MEENVTRHAPPAMLPGLNGLRSLAACFVLLIHVYQVAAFNGDQWANTIYYRYSLIGKSMVNLFFVISGFIITYILYREKEKTGRISLKNFYIKRILRIWPLYFGLLLLVAVIYGLGGLLAPFEPLRGTGLLLVLLFAVTLTAFFGDLNYSVFPHYWSLSVEEQFYIFWPLIFKKIKPGHVIRFCSFIIVGMVLIRNAVSFIGSHWHVSGTGPLQDVLYQSMFGSIAIGIIGAHLVIQRSGWLKYFFSKPVQLIAWAVFISTVLRPYYIPYVYAEVLALADLVLVLNVTMNKRSVVSLENRVMDHSGKISYGIYMFHWPLCVIAANLFKRTGLWERSVELYQIPLLLTTFIFVYFVSSVSYRYFESYFLKLKPAVRS